MKRFLLSPLLFWSTVIMAIVGRADGRNFKVGWLSASSTCGDSVSKNKEHPANDTNHIDTAWQHALRRIADERLLGNGGHSLSLVRRLNANCTTPVSAFIQARELLETENVDVLITGPLVNNNISKYQRQAELAVAYLAAMKRRLHIVLLISSSSSTNPSLAQSRPPEQRFPTMLRMSTTVENYLHAVVQMFVHNNWTRLAIFSTTASNSNSCAPAMYQLLNLFAFRRGFYITFSRFYNATPNESILLKDMKTASQLTRLIIYCLDSDGTNNVDGEGKFLQAASNNNMATGEYMFMRLHFNNRFEDKFSCLRRASSKLTENGLLQRGKDWYLSHVLTRASSDDTGTSDNSRAINPVSAVSNNEDDIVLESGDNQAPTSVDKSQTLIGARFGDAVYTYAKALGEALRMKSGTGAVMDNADEMVALARRQSFYGETGFVEFDEANTRISNFTLYDLSESRKGFEPKQTYVTKDNRWLSHKPFLFLGQSDSTRFTTTPRCGFYGELCGRNGKMLETGQTRRYTSAAAELRSRILIGGLFLMGSIVVIVFLMYFLNRRKRILVLENAMWRIPLSEVSIMKRLKRHKSLHSMSTMSSEEELGPKEQQLKPPPSITLTASSSSLRKLRGRKEINRQNTSASSEGGSSMQSKASQGVGSMDMDKSSLTAATNATVTLGDARDGALWIGRFSGQLVVLKFMPLVERHLESADKARLSKMRKLQHPNVCVFYGIAYGAVGDAANKGGESGTKTSIPFLLMEYCARGSVRDVLNNDLIRPDAKFKVSIVHDMVEGLFYLHNSPLRMHGQLKTDNVVIDRRWVAKLTDYGLLQHKTDNLLLAPALLGAFSADKQAELYKSQVFTAPEVLREGIKSMTPAADVYSLSMVIYELLAEIEPYSAVGLGPKDIINRIISGEALAFRPTFTWDNVLLSGDGSSMNESIKRTLVTTVKRCWDEHEQNRPPLRDVRRKVRDLSAQLFGKHFNLFERVLSELEKHAGQLEKVVSERTRELETEKQKTEKLLERMLPKLVAQRLKTGEPVETELFLSATIFFSDIVGFTQIAARSHPMQIINLLNSLYSLMDSLLERYDAFKVETIGDAYMVVSGLPVRNEQRHVKEISDLALEVRDKLSGFYLPPPNGNESLKMRIGVHTGACAAGVVGQAMPHYCVFGEAVSTAMLMESTSQPQKIQLSETSCTLLTDAFPGQYKLTERTAAEKLVQNKNPLLKFTFCLQLKIGPIYFDKDRKDQPIFEF